MSAAPIESAPRRAARLLARTPATSHCVQFYEDDAFMDDVVGGLVLDGVARGEATVLVVTRARTEALARWLRERGRDLDALRASGDVTLRDAASSLAALMDGERPDRTRFRASLEPILDACARRSATTRAYGEMVDVLCRHGNTRGALELEALWNELRAERPFSLVCGYSMKSFAHAEDARTFADVCRGHSHVLPSEAYVDPVDEDLRHRAIASLLQRARALESEIDDRKRIEERLREALRERDEFIAVAGHELRTPLTVMKLQVEGLLSAAGSVTDDRLRERAERGRRSIRRLTTLVDRLLEVSRSSSHELVLEREDLDLVSLAREAIDRLAQHPARHASEVTLDAPPSLRGRWDRLRVEQVLENVLANAERYGRGGPIAVRIEVIDGGARVAVRDHGIGIPDADRERIFDRFERAVSSDHFGGLGLGLWLVRRIVEAHGGTIRVAEVDGPGAELVIDLPLDG